MHHTNAANRILVLREYFPVPVQQRRGRLGTIPRNDHPKIEYPEILISLNIEIILELIQNIEGSVSDIYAIDVVIAPRALSYSRARSVEFLKIEITGRGGWAPIQRQILKPKGFSTIST
jgi:hypothetical protein